MPNITLTDFIHDTAHILTYKSTEFNQFQNGVTFI